MSSNSGIEEQINLPGFVQRAFGLEPRILIRVFRFLIRAFRGGEAGTGSTKQKNEAAKTCDAKGSMECCKF